MKFYTVHKTIQFWHKSWYERRKTGENTVIPYSNIYIYTVYTVYIYIYIYCIYRIYIYILYIYVYIYIYTLYIYIYIKGIVYPNFKLSENVLTLRPSRMYSRWVCFFIRTDLEKSSIASLARQSSQVELYCHSATCGDIQWNEMSSLTGPRCYINTDIQQWSKTL